MMVFHGSHGYMGISYTPVKRFLRKTTLSNGLPPILGSQIDGTKCQLLVTVPIQIGQLADPLLLKCKTG